MHEKPKNERRDEHVHFNVTRSQRAYVEATRARYARDVGRSDISMGEFVVKMCYRYNEGSIRPERMEKELSANLSALDALIEELTAIRDSNASALSEAEKEMDEDGE